MNDIQEARDVFAKWRDGTMRAPWIAATSWGYPAFGDAIIAADNRMQL